MQKIAIFIPEGNSTFGKFTPMNSNCSPAAVSLCLMMLLAWNTAISTTPMFWDLNRDTFPIEIGGVITNATGTPIKDVVVDFYSSLPDTSQTTLADGEYQFSMVFDTQPNYNFVSIDPSRDGDDKNGVTILDLIKIQKYLLGGESFDEYQLIAADVNRSQSVTAIDLIEIRKLILGITHEFANVPSWVFVPETLKMNATQSIYNADFIAVKKGDVNRTARQQLTNLVSRNGKHEIPILTEQQFYSAGEKITIELTWAEVVNLMGFQFTMSSRDLEFEKIISDLILIVEENYVLERDKITIAWMDIAGRNFEADDIIMTIIAKAKSKGNLQSGLSMNATITEGQVITSDEDILIPTLRFSGDQIQHPEDQSSSPTFINCTSEPVPLCVSDPGVRIPANNQFFLGENHPDATSCSVHISRQTTVQTNCPGNLTYEVNIYLFESAEAILLQSATMVTPDSLSTALLSFDSELATDEVIKANGIPYTTGCARYHKIVWSVTDACGETSECEMLIDVYDCSLPVHTGNALQILTSNTIGYLDLHLSDFVIPSSDDCTSSGDYLYSFSPDFHDPDSLFHICDFDAWGVELAYPIWIADAGRDLNCDGVVAWDERQIVVHFIYIVIIDSGNVDCSPDCYFRTTVLDQTGAGIKNVSVTISNNTQSATYMTDSNGIVMTLGIPGNFLTVEHSKTDFHKNGVNTLDIVKIIKHLLGIQLFTSPYHFIAADVSRSAHVSAIDIIIMRKLILGIIEEFPGGQSWEFIRDNYVFQEPNNPWSAIIPPDTFFYCQTASLDFIGIKLGDLNNTATPNANSIRPRNDYPVINWITDQQHFNTGEEIEIPVYANSLKSMQGFQLTFSSPALEFIDMQSDILNLEESFALFGNHLTMAWIDLEAIEMQKDDILFTIRAKAQKNGNLKESLSINSTITKAELYTPDEEIYIPQLMVRTEHQESFSTPNPWTDKTSLAFTLDKSGNVQLEVLNIDGKTVFATSNFFHKGENSFEITASDFAEKGMLIYQLRSGDQAVTGKMVKL